MVEYSKNFKRSWSVNLWIKVALCILNLEFGDDNFGCHWLLWWWLIFTGYLINMDIFIINTLKWVFIFTATLIYCNNYSAIQITHNNVFHECAKHIEINCHFIEQSFSPNSSYISILSVNFENLTVRLHVLIIFFMHVKFQEDQRSIAISSNKC